MTHEPNPRVGGPFRCSKCRNMRGTTIHCHHCEMRKDLEQLTTLNVQTDRHSKKYLDALCVLDNPNEYDARDVVDARRYATAYMDGYNQSKLNK